MQDLGVKKWRQIQGCNPLCASVGQPRLSVVDGGAQAAGAVSGSRSGGTAAAAAPGVNALEAETLDGHVLAPVVDHGRQNGQQHDEDHEKGDQDGGRDGDWMKAVGSGAQVTLVAALTLLRNHLLLILPIVHFFRLILGPGHFSQPEELKREN